MKTTSKLSAAFLTGAVLFASQASAGVNSVNVLDNWDHPTEGHLLAHVSEPDVDKSEMSEDHTRFLWDEDIYRSQ